MGLNDYLLIARRRWMMILAFVVVGIVAAAAYTSSLSATYTSTTRLYVTMATGTSVSDSLQGNTAAQQRMSSYANLVTSDRVMDATIAELSLDSTTGALAAQTTVDFAPATVLLDVSVTQNNPEDARIVTDMVAAKFRELVGELEQTETGAAPAARVDVVDLASTPTGSGGPAPTRNLLLGLIAGLALGCAAAYVRDRLDSHIRTSGQVASLSDAPFLGTVAHSTRPEDSRRLALRLDHAMTPYESRAILVTGPSRGSEPDIVLALAKSLCDLGAAVLVVDACTDGSGVSSRMRGGDSVGLADLLRSPTRAPIEATRPSHIEGLRILPLGDADARTGSLFASPRCSTIMSDLRSVHNYVIIDATSTTDETDALALAVEADAVLVGVETASTTVAELRTYFGELETVGASVVGSVLLPHQSRKRFSLSKLFPSKTPAEQISATPVDAKSKKKAKPAKPAPEAANRPATRTAPQPESRSAAPAVEDGPRTHARSTQRPQQVRPPYAEQPRAFTPPPVDPEPRHGGWTPASTPADDANTDRMSVAGIRAAYEQQQVQDRSTGTAFDEPYPDVADADTAYAPEDVVDAPIVDESVETPIADEAEEAVVGDSADGEISDVATADEVAADEVTADSVVTDGVVTDGVVVDDAATDAEVADDSGADEVGADEVVADEVAPETVVTEEASSDASVADDAPADDDATTRPDGSTGADSTGTESRKSGQSTGSEGSRSRSSRITPARFDPKRSQRVNR